jgi:hypothetical protein
MDRVAAKHFYQDEGDKIKQNWFFYEYANVLYAKIEEDPRLAAYRKKQGEAKIVAFCVYFTKRMRHSLYLAYSQQAEGVRIDARYIYEFYPGNSRTQTQRLLEAAGAAWNEHYEVCRVCPNQCLKYGFELTDAFDNQAEVG